MKIPKSIKVGGHTLEIKYPHTFAETNEFWGLLNNAKKIIYLADTDTNGGRRKDSCIAVTFIHEVLHAIDDFTNCGVFAGPAGEKNIQAFSEAIYQVLIDNEMMQ